MDLKGKDLLGSIFFNSKTLSRIATLPAGVNIAHVVKKANQQLTVPVTVSGGAVGGGAKENLYVIALPPDQLRNGLLHHWICDHFITQSRRYSLEN